MRVCLVRAEPKPPACLVAALRRATSLAYIRYIGVHRRFRTLGRTRMQFGFCFMPNIDEIGFYRHIESLGYQSAWVADSQMLFSDCYAVLALAARQTSRLRLGPGTAICGTRIPPVHAAAMMTLNRLAPGRMFLGIGTGNTAMRSMGQRPMRIAAFDAYLRVLAALLRGETV